MHTFLALGDSYTIGEGVPPDANWPTQLVGRLQGEGFAMGDPRIVATTGWTADELSAALDAEVLAPPYALVTLSVGVNDQYRGRPLDGYRLQFHTLLERAIALAGGDAARVVVVSIPDWGVTPFACDAGRDAGEVASQIDAFNAVARREVEAAHARCVDVTQISRAPATRDGFAADGLHPSRTQYVRWVDAILPVARAALGAA